MSALRSKPDSFDLHVKSFCFCNGESESQIISAGDDFSLKFFDLEKKEVKKYIDAEDEINALYFIEKKKILLFAYGAQLKYININDNDEITNLSESVSLTKFNTNIKAINYSKNFNTAIAFADDEEIHLIDLETLEINKIPSQHEGSVRSIFVEHNLLITCGYDGMMIINKFTSSINFEFLSKVRLSNKLKYNDVQHLSVDVLENKYLFVAGNFLLRRIKIENEANLNNPLIEMESSVCHSDDIVYLKLLFNKFLFTLEKSGFTKIYYVKSFDNFMLLQSFNIYYELNKSPENYKLDKFSFFADERENIKSAQIYYCYGNQSEKIFYGVLNNLYSLVEQEMKKKNKEAAVHKDFQFKEIDDLIFDNKPGIECDDQMDICEEENKNEKNKKHIKSKKEKKSKKNKKEKKEKKKDDQWFLDDQPQVNSEFNDAPESEEDDEDSNSSENSESKKKFKKSAGDILGISEIEDDNGDIKSVDEIEKSIKFIPFKRLFKSIDREEKLRKMVGYESLADKIIDCLPQGAFNNNPELTFTKETEKKNNLNYICWNMIGTISIRNDENFKFIDIDFSEITNKKKLILIDKNNLTLGIMNNCGALLASQIEEENMDEYEKEEKSKNAIVEFKTIHNWGKYKDWSITLPQNESPICLAIGVDWCAVYTDLYYIRVFSLFGTEKMIFSAPANIISMAGYEEYLAIVYHTATPLFGNQTLRFKIFDGNNNFNEIIDGFLPLSPYSKLKYFTFSEDGVLLSFDSENILRGFSFGFSNNWIPLLDLYESYNKSSNNFWMIGMEDSEVYGIELPKIHDVPLVSHKYSIITHKLKIPLAANQLSNGELKNNETNATENEPNKFSCLTNLFFLDHDKWRNEKYSRIKELRSIKNADYYYTDNIKDDTMLNLKKKEHDKQVLNLMKDFLLSKESEKTIDLFDSLTLKKSKDLAIQLAEGMEKYELAEFMKNKLKLEGMISSYNNSKTIINYAPNNVKNTTMFNDPFTKERDTNNEKFSDKFSGMNIVSNNNNKSSANIFGTNTLGSLAMKIDSYKNLEDEVRDEMENLLEGNEFAPNNEDLNSVGQKVLKDFSVLDRKSSNPFLKNYDSNKQSNTNLFDDLSRTISAGNNANNLLKNTNPEELNFKDVNKKIGFKRKNNEVNSSEDAKKNLEAETQKTLNKKQKK